MISTAVSSKLLKSMAKIEGFNFIETLTGFKWMGNKAYDLISKGKTVLFAYEEAIGFMIGTSVLDKDGITTGINVAQLAVYFKSTGQLLTDQLNQIYKLYGFHYSITSYFICYEQSVIKAIFDRLANFNGQNSVKIFFLTSSICFLYLILTFFFLLIEFSNNYILSFFYLFASFFQVLVSAFCIFV